jgi:hypothetical protein
MAKKPDTIKDLELEPDAWERFERAVGVVAKSPPQHRKAAKKKKHSRKSIKKEK